MPINRFVGNQAFDPEHIKAMSGAFEQACSTLGLSVRIDPLTEIVAKQIIKLARCGTRTEAALYLATIQEFKSDPQ